VAARLAEAGAHKWHYAALVSLIELGPASQADLSRRTGIFRSDMVTVVNELAEGGYVERAPDPLDRRRSVITATRRGRRHLQRLHAIVDRAQEELLAPLSLAERGQLTVLLLNVDRYHESESRRAAPSG
jgi:MarR family transcriptional regulator, lower aerobic nicotinate degradation pathway regulator